MSKYLLSDEESGRGESTNSPLVKDKVNIYNRYYTVEKIPSNIF